MSSVVPTVKVVSGSPVPSKEKPKFPVLTERPKSLGSPTGTDHRVFVSIGVSFDTPTSGISLVRQNVSGSWTVRHLDLPSRSLVCLDKSSEYSEFYTVLNGIIQNLNEPWVVGTKERI